MALLNIIFENSYIFCLSFRNLSTKNIFNTERCKKYFHHLDWKRQIFPSFICINILQYYVSLMRSDKLCKNNEEDLKFLYCFIIKNRTIYYCIMDDEINRNIFNHMPR